jgi:hypothetical protein
LLGPALGEIGGAGAVSRLRQPDPNRSAVRSGDGSSEPIERDLRVPFRRRHAKHAQPEERGYEVTDGIEVGALASPAAGERKVRRLLGGPVPVRRLELVTANCTISAPNLNACLRA